MYVNCLNPDTICVFQWLHDNCAENLKVQLDNLKQNSGQKKYGFFFLTIPLKQVLGEVRGVAFYITSHKQAQ